MYWPDLSDMKRRRVATVKQIKTVDAVRVIAVVMVLTWGCNLRGLRVVTMSIDTPTSCQIIGYGYIERPWCFDFRGYQVPYVIQYPEEFWYPFLHTRTTTDVLVTCDVLFLNNGLFIPEGLVWVLVWAWKEVEWHTLGRLHFWRGPAGKCTQSSGPDPCLRPSKMRTPCSCSQYTDCNQNKEEMKQFWWSQLDSMIWGQVKVM